MSDNVWYYVASQSEDKESATLWMVLRDESGYLCRTWQLAGFERRKVEAWMRMTEQRRSKSLAIDPPPDIRDMTPAEAHFEKIHEARSISARAGIRRCAGMPLNFSGRSTR